MRRISLRRRVFMALALVAALGLVCVGASALTLQRGTPRALTGTLGNVQVHDVVDLVGLSGYVDQTGIVSPAPAVIPTRRVQFDVLNEAGNGSIFEFRVDYAPGTSVIGARVAEGFFDGAGSQSTFWRGTGLTTLFDAGLGTYNYDTGFGGEWEIDFAADHVTWRQIANGFFPDTATGLTEFGFNPTFSLNFAPETLLDLQPASVTGRLPTGAPVSAMGFVLSAVPEPATLLMVALAAGSCVIGRGRARR